MPSAASHGKICSKPLGLQGFGLIISAPPAHRYKADLNQEEPTMTKRLHKQELIDAVKSQITEKRPDITKANVEAVTDAL